MKKIQKTSKREYRSTVILKQFKKKYIYRKKNSEIVQSSTLKELIIKKKKREKLNPTEAFEPLMERRYS